MSGLFRPKGVNTNSPVVASIQLQTSLIGRPIPQVYGTRRVSANVIDYDDFTAIPHTTSQGGKGGGGGSTSTSYQYKAAVIFGICQGPINTLTSGCWASKDRTSLTDLGLTTAVGSLGQSAPAHWTTNHPTKALGYSGLAYTHTAAFDMGDNASLPTMSFSVSAFFQSSSGTGIGDADISLIVNDLLTGDRTGAGFPSAYVGSLDDMSDYTIALGIGASPAYVEQAPAAQMIESLCRIGNTAVFFSDGLLKFVPAADAAVSGNGHSYTPPTTVRYDFTDDDFIYQKGEQPVVIERRRGSDAPNSLSVTFYDALLEYAQNRITVTDENAIALYGLRTAPDETLDEICDAAAANMVARLRLQRMQYQRNTYRFRVGRHYELLEPMDIVRLTESTGTPLNLVPVRILDTNLGTDGTFSITAEDYFGSVGALPEYTYQTIGGYVPDYNADPGDVSVPVIFDAPFELTESGFEIWLAVAGVGALWGGCVVWMSTDGSTYRQVGEVKNPARYGALTGAVLAGSDPDSATTVPITLALSNGTLSSGTADDANNAVTLCLMGREVFAYQTATLTGTNTYNLGTLLRRGLYRSTRTSHASGTPFVRIDSSVVSIPYDKTMIGKTIYFKLTSFNVWGSGHQDVSSSSVHTYDVLGPIGGIAGDRSLIDTRSWVVGKIDSQGNYEDAFDGSNHDSSIVLAGIAGNPIGPNYRVVPLWKSVGVGSGLNGGWSNTRDLYGISTSRSYRFTVWFRWNGTGDPKIQFGPGATYVSQLNGTVTSDPYFWTGLLSTLGIEPNRWYLLCGVVHGSDYETTSSFFSGCYDSFTGRRVPLGSGRDGVSTPYADSYGSEFKWVSGGVPHATHRVNQSGTDNYGCSVWFADPRVDELNGQEPSLSALIVPPSGDKGIGAPLVPDNEFSTGAIDPLWVTSGYHAIMMPTGGEFGGYANFTNPGGVILAGLLHAVRTPDNVILTGKEIKIVVRYRRVGSLTMISGQPAVSLVVGLTTYNTPQDPLGSPNGSATAGQVDLYTTVGGQLITDNEWYTSVFTYSLDNAPGGGSTVYKYYAVNVGVLALGSSGEVHVDSLEAFPI